MKSPEHVKLERLIPIAAQLAAALHLGSDDIRPGDHDLRCALKKLALGLRGHTGDLQAAFKSYRSAIEAILETLPPSDEFARAVDALKIGLADRSCQCCCPKNEPPCSRARSTNDRVHRGGNCIAPIKSLYEDVEQDIVQLWRQIFGEAKLPSLQLATVHLDFIDKQAVFKDFSLIGKARIVDQPHPTTAITVAFYDSAFDWEQFTLLPYLIYHEILCHGLQDVYDVNGGSVPRAARYPAIDSCVWSEGWMDTIAHYLATAWLRRCGTRHHINGQCMRRAERWIDEYHDARYGVDGRILSAERHFGRQAFERIKTNITAPEFPESSAQDLLIRFSVLLNACVLPFVPAGETPNDRRARIVKALDLLAVGSEPVSARRMMESFVASRDFNGLAA